MIKFRIDVTFEMGTVLYGICLFLDNSNLSDSIFMSNRDGGEESRIAEKQRERECVCERGSTYQKRRDSVGHKMSH